MSSDDLDSSGATIAPPPHASSRPPASARRSPQPPLHAHEERRAMQDGRSGGRGSRSAEVAHRMQEQSCLGLNRP